MARLRIAELTQSLSNTGARWTAAETPMSLLDEGKRNRMLGAIVPPGYAKPLATAVSPVAHYDPEVDWRDRNGNHVSPVKIQGGCGTCVSFTVAGVAEAMASIEKGVVKDFSEADLHFCSSHGPSCTGWWHSDAFNQAMVRGLLDEKDFVYASAFTGNDIWTGAASCLNISDRSMKTVKLGALNKWFHPVDVKNYLTTTGPVSAVLAVYTDFFNYKAGVYHKVSGNFEGMHCVVIVGYSESEQCWIAKNSWDVTWGENGYFKLAYGECNEGDYEKIGISGLTFPSAPSKETWLEKLIRIVSAQAALGK